jgi:ubiquinol-cytochrome c reductase cytochrome b subunit
LFIMPFLPKTKFQSLSFYPVGKLIFWILVVVFLLLTYVGAIPVEDPYIVLGQALGWVYFSYFFAISYVNQRWDLLI